MRACKNVDYFDSRISPLHCADCERMIRAYGDYSVCPWCGDKSELTGDVAELKGLTIV